MVYQKTLSGNREEDYALAIGQAVALWEADLPLTSNLANISALLRHCLDRINWVGFYLRQDKGSQLILGPFQGLPACTRIPLGTGVCGTAAASGKTLLVPDVHEFPGHIACDSASRSEIVVPVVKEGTVRGVLDVDSPERSRFDAIDKEWLEKLVQALIPLWPLKD
jgi:L-methionine (R)-S-oxide reductase